MHAFMLLLNLNAIQIIRNDKNNTLSEVSEGNACEHVRPYVYEITL